MSFAITGGNDDEKLTSNLEQNQLLLALSVVMTLGLSAPMVMADEDDTGEEVRTEARGNANANANAELGLSVAGAAQQAQEEGSSVSAAVLAALEAGVERAVVKKQKMLQERGRGVADVAMNAASEGRTAIGEVVRSEAGGGRKILAQQ